MIAKGGTNNQNIRIMTEENKNQGKRLGETSELHTAAEVQDCHQAGMVL